MKQIFLFLFLLPIIGRGQIIYTFAGDSTIGYSGDGGQATAAALNSPHSVSLDIWGNIYIADFGNNNIRKIDIVTGVISTIAGNGVAGYSGDGGAATSAKLNGPTCVVVDSLGNIYIADDFNNRVRKVNFADGVITTIAGNGTSGDSGDGGAATDAELYSPIGIALDRSMNYYIVCAMSTRVRKVNSAGTISTFAGTSTSGYSGDGGPATGAEFVMPSRVASDLFGNVYVSDWGCNCIRKIRSDGIISTFAGNDTAGYNGDWLPATSAKLDGVVGVVSDINGNVYVAEYLNNRVRRINSENKLIYTIAGCGISGYLGDGNTATSAELNGPYGVTIDLGGNIYIADADNARIRKINGICGNTDICLGTTTTFSYPSLSGYWTSSNPLIASIDSITGVTTGITSGVAVISYTDSGSVYYVKLKVDTIPNSGIVTGVDSVCIGFTDTLSTASYSGIWYTSNGAVGVSSSGVLTGLSTGFDTVFYVLANACGSDTSIFPVSVPDSLTCSPLNLNKNELHLGNLSLYPNPSYSLLTISYPIQITKVTIANTLGQIVYANYCDKREIQINVSGFQNGIYFVTINGLEVRMFRRSSNLNSLS